jgi:hypothetical protein
MAQSVVSDASKVGDNYYRTKVVDNGDGTYGSTLFRTDANGGNEVPIAGYGGAGTTTSTEINTTNATAEEQQLLADPNSQLNQVRRQQVQSTEDDFFGATGGTAQQKEALNKSAGKANQATKPEAKDGEGGKPADDKAKKEFNEENNSFKENTRLKYGDVKYPEDLSVKYQDCIKFSILKYRPSLASATSRSSGSSSSGVSRAVTIDAKGNPTIGKEILGTITLPIPAGINDSNQVSWQEDTINDLQKAAGDIASRFVVGGAKEAEGAVTKAGEQAAGGIKSGELQQGLAGKIASFAVGSDKLQQRAYGSIFNNNLELLFTSPSLRSFSFTFKLSPRNPIEAKNIMKIIRFFKQAMSVKRSKTSLLLKSPHTFAISYLTSNKQHPYLNKFKECALTGFNVDYTPEGQYMTYMGSKPDERSMISYSISLQFQELEPVFDDEYGNESPDQILNVGY